MSKGASSPEKKRTWRNMIRMGAILASAVASNVAAVKTGVAGQKRGRASAKG